MGIRVEDAMSFFPRETTLVERDKESRSTPPGLWDSPAIVRKGKDPERDGLSHLGLVRPAF